MNNLTLEFDIVPSDVSKPLGFEFWVNDQQITNIESLSELKHLSYDFDGEKDQQYSVKLVVKNKINGYTQINEQGEIVSDSLITIKNFKIDEFEIDQVIQNIAVYHHNFNGSQPWSDNKFYHDAGCNGTISFSFYTPSYLWLLENI